MKFGIFYELQLPKPWRADSEPLLFKNALSQVELADRLGYDYAWAVEHHFLEEYSHSSAPEVFLAAASQRTKTIRLGHGIVQLPSSPPARVAERIASLDLVSGGRIEFGVGEGSTTIELDPFNVAMSDKRAVFEDAMRAIMPMFGDAPCAYSGTHHQFPMRNVLPKPLQKPHPPLWLACSQIDTIAYAGRRGLGALGFQFVSAEAAHAWVNAYYNALLKNLDRLGTYQVNPNMALVSFFMCAPTDAEARRRADGATFFQWCLRYYATPRATEEATSPGRSSLWEQYTAWKRDNADAVERSMAAGLIGSPETLRRKIRGFEDTHIDQVILLNQTGHTSHEHICESLELFAREVMPEFHANIPAHDDWKAGVLRGDIRLSELDTSAFASWTSKGPAATDVSPVRP